jgi:hypothetical protein
MPFWQGWVRLLAFHEACQPARPPFWQGWVRLSRFLARVDGWDEATKPANFIQIDFGFVLQIFRESAPTIHGRTIDKCFPDCHWVRFVILMYWPSAFVAQCLMSLTDHERGDLTESSEGIDTPDCGV